MLRSPIKNHTAHLHGHKIKKTPQKILVNPLLKEKMMIILAGKIDERAILYSIAAYELGKRHVHTNH